MKEVDVLRSLLLNSISHDEVESLSIQSPKEAGGFGGDCCVSGSIVEKGQLTEIGARSEGCNFCGELVFGLES